MGNKTESRKIAVYPGTFDPLTLGHLDIIKRACGLFDEVIVAAAESTSKNTLLNITERLEIITIAANGLSNCRVVSFNGLLTVFAESVGAEVIVRGLRTVSDFEYEYQMALTNRHMAQNIETVFLMPSEKYAYISSTLVREIVKFGGRADDFIPEAAAIILNNKFSK